MSNDLISRSALISRIESERREWGEDYDAGQILGDIEDMPTAYDVDKVVEQLSCKECESCKLQEVCNGIFLDGFFEKIIEIVKGGGEDE